MTNLLVIAELIANLSAAILWQILCVLNYCSLQVTGCLNALRHSAAA